jgi:hypothetical protein
MSTVRVSMIALLACASCGGRSLAPDAAAPSSDGWVAEVSATDSSSDDGEVTELSTDDGSVADGAALEVPGTEISSCDPAGIPPGTADRLAGLDPAVGPPPTMGDFVRATIEGQSYDFSTTFDAPTSTSGDGVTPRFARGFGQNLSSVTIYPGASGAWRLGHSDCTSFSLGFGNPAVGLESDLWYSKDCCTLNVTKLPTTYGDTFEGTFSGVVLDPGRAKLRITEGRSG